VNGPPLPPSASTLSAGGAAPSGKRSTEHFVTLFDDSFLPLGLALYQSLIDHAQPFHLWVVAVDETVEAHLTKFRPSVAISCADRNIRPRLLEVKPEHARRYCWTITPFVCQAVLDWDASVAATYVDADVLFLDDPRAAGGTDRGARLSPNALLQYDRARQRPVCVQFLTFDRSPEAGRVTWWQERCLEWCFARYEDGKFGDQVYLDRWPELFGNDVHIVRQVKKTLAPWNVRHFADRYANNTAAWKPVMFHFHGFRLLSPHRARLYSFYNVGREGDRIYDAYLAAVSRSLKTLHAAEINTPNHALPHERFALWNRLLRALNHTERYAAIP
jgi:hypothetical protein